MRRINAPVSIAVRRNGFRVRTICRLKFAPGQDIAGWVNYRGKVHPVFRDPKGALYLNEDGWASTRPYPLTAAQDAYRNWRALPLLKGRFGPENG